MSARCGMIEHDRHVKVLRVCKLCKVNPVQCCTWIGRMAILKMMTNYNPRIFDIQTISGYLIFRLDATKSRFPITVWSIMALKEMNQVESGKRLLESQDTQQIKVKNGEYRSEICPVLSTKYVPIISNEYQLVQICKNMYQYVTICTIMYLCKPIMHL